MINVWKRMDYMQNNVNHPNFNGQHNLGFAFGARVCGGWDLPDHLRENIICFDETYQSNRDESRP